MTKKEIRSNWYYFDALSTQLENTTQYVDHSIDEDGNTINGKTFSNEFAKILLLTASEFEVVSKSLCSVANLDISENANIIEITRAILEKYPKIGDTAITTPYQSIKPLKDWRIEYRQNETQNQPTVEGINWWKGHNEIKHDRFRNFKMANLENCISSLASLMVLELYLTKESLGDILSHNCHYFSSGVEHKSLMLKTGEKLPDFV